MNTIHTQVLVQLNCQLISPIWLFTDEKLLWKQLGPFTSIWVHDYLTLAPFWFLGVSWEDDWAFYLLSQRIWSWSGYSSFLLTINASILKSNIYLRSYSVLRVRSLALTQNLLKIFGQNFTWYFRHFKLRNLALFCCNKRRVKLQFAIQSTLPLFP